VNSSPALAEGHVYIDDLLGPVYAIDSETGSLLWTEGTKIANINPTVANDTVLIGESPMYALDAATGAVE
jgi:outer membrane protein assembly factor BamB